MNKKRLVLNELNHPFHIVDPSPWPFLTGFSLLFLTFGAALYMHFYKEGFIIFLFGLILVIACAALWWRDVAIEGTFEGHYTSYVTRGLKMGIVFFIVSEVMFFFTFFWGFFHSSLNPTWQIGCIWPPKGIIPLNPFHIPLLNTIVLVTSGAYITWAHYSLLLGYRKQVINGLIYTLIFAILFTLLQWFEYRNAPFNISDGIYGSVFYMTTGFHGLHVIIGSIWIGVTLWRHINYHFTRETHICFEGSSWYWHFVDIVWLFVYFFIYWWGYNA